MGRYKFPFASPWIDLVPPHGFCGGMWWVSCWSCCIDVHCPPLPQKKSQSNGITGDSETCQVPQLAQNSTMSAAMPFPHGSIRRSYSLEPAFDSNRKTPDPFESCNRAIPFTRDPPAAPLRRRPGVGCFDPSRKPMIQVSSLKHYSPGAVIRWPAGACGTLDFSAAMSALSCGAERSRGSVNESGSSRGTESERRSGSTGCPRMGVCICMYLIFVDMNYRVSTLRIVYKRINDVYIM